MRILDTKTPATIVALLSLLHGCDAADKKGAPNADQPPAVRSLLTDLLMSRPIQNDPVDIRAILDGSPIHVGPPFRVFPCTMDINAPATFAAGFKESDYSLLYYPIKRNGFTVCALLAEQESGRSRPIGYGFTDFVRSIERTDAEMRGARAGTERVIFHIPEFGLYFFRVRDRIISPFDNSAIGIRAGETYDAQKTMSTIRVRMMERTREEQKKSMTTIQGFIERPAN